MVAKSLEHLLLLLNQLEGSSLSLPQRILLYTLIIGELKTRIHTLADQQISVERSSAEDD